MMTWFYTHSAPVASYWAVYPDGRRCSVTLDDAKAFGFEWEKTGVRVVTVIRIQPIQAVGELELL